MEPEKEIKPKNESQGEDLYLDLDLNENEHGYEYEYERVSNPLQIDLVLDVIFRHLSHSPLTLASCRQVCRQWLELSEPYFRDLCRRNQRNIVRIPDSDALFSFLPTFVLYANRQLEYLQDRRSQTPTFYDHENVSEDEEESKYEDCYQTLEEIPGLTLTSHSNSNSTSNSSLDSILTTTPVPDPDPDPPGSADSSPLSLWTRFELNYFSMDLYNRQLFFNVCASTVKSLTIHSAVSPNIVHLFSILVNSVPQLERLELLELRSMITNQLSRSVSRYLNVEIGQNRIAEFIEWFEKLKNCTNSEKTGENLSQVPFNHLPRLSALRIVVQIEAEDGETSRRFFSSLFQLMPNLEEFSVSSQDMTIESTTIPGVLLALRDHPSLLGRLTSLRIDDLDNVGLNTLVSFHRHFGLNLKVLDLTAFANCVEQSAVEALIRSQAESLEELTIGGKYCRGGGANFKLDLGPPFCMLRLRKLDFVSGFSVGSLFERTQVMTWLNLDYSNQLPKLEQIGLHYITRYSMDLLWPETLISNSTSASTSTSSSTSTSTSTLPSPTFGRTLTCSPCLTVHRLDVTGDEQLEPRKLRILALLFPNVTDVTLNPDNGPILQTLFQVWPRLRRLVLRFPVVLEDINYYFTGLPDLAPPSLRPTLTFDLENCPREPSVLLLKDLEELCIHVKLDRMYMYRVDSKNVISGTTLTHALPFLTSLRKLTIDQSVVTKESLRLLHQTLNLEKCLVGDRFGQEIDFRNEEPEPEQEPEQGGENNIKIKDEEQEYYDSRSIKVIYSSKHNLDWRKMFQNKP